MDNQTCLCDNDSESFSFNVAKQVAVFVKKNLKGVLTVSVNNL